MYELILTRKAQRFYQNADSSLVSRLNRCAVKFIDKSEISPSTLPNNLENAPLLSVIEGHL